MTLRCPLCRINYGFDKYGRKGDGYSFYDNERDAVCASDTIFIDRRIINLQWSFA